MIFTKAIATKGNLVSSFVFKDEEERAYWVENELPKLRDKYGTVSIAREYDLPGLQVGDTCQVFGEGSDKFKIEGLFMYSPYRYGFILDSGFSEEVAKCYIYEIK